MSRLQSAAPKSARAWISASSGSCSWPRTRTGDRQSIADIGQVIFEVAVFVGLRIERYTADLAVAGGEAPADRTHAAPFGTIDRHCIQEPERGCEHFGANPLARALHVTGRAGEIELSAPCVEIALAVLVGLERARIVGNLDLERLAAGCKRHLGGPGCPFVFPARKERLAIGLAAAVQRQFERNDLAFLLVEIGIVLADADALVRKAIRVALAVPERLGEHLLAHVEREFIR